MKLFRNTDRPDPSSMANDILAVIEARAAQHQDTSFEVLHREVPGFTTPIWPILHEAPTLVASSNPEHILIWVGHSPAAHQALLELLAKGRITAAPCRPDVYKEAEHMPRRPVLTDPLAAVESQHWFPVVLRPGVLKLAPVEAADITHSGGEGGSVSHV